ncbi:hypothetical protein DPMN_053213 [Dreissena polymorpha]|uniref:Uncharacterized protein n=1 Tax=Dreissena polymorpha TaxID=45954 RepID=A0A9D4CMW6_DREPO|nr:hypothetical protein DPMN_053213 [Dreissena polymorpha]
MLHRTSSFPQGLHGVNNGMQITQVSSENPIFYSRTQCLNATSRLLEHRTQCLNATSRLQQNIPPSTQHPNLIFSMQSPNAAFGMQPHNVTSSI